MKTKMRIGVDIGGTFTDCVVIDEDSVIHRFKELSTPKDPSIGLYNVINKAPLFRLSRRLMLSAGYRQFKYKRTDGSGDDEIVQSVKDMIPITRMIQTADTLRYLYMGGRIGKAQHLFGSLLNIKPLIGMEDGVIVPLGQARSRLGAYRKIVGMMEEDVGPTGRVKVAFVHAAALEEVKKLRAMVEERLTCVEVLMAELSPALGVHTGPGTAGVCYFPV